MSGNIKKEGLSALDSYVYEPVVCKKEDEQKDRSRSPPCMKILCIVLLVASMTVNVTIGGYLLYDSYLDKPDNHLKHNDNKLKSSVDNYVCASCSLLNIPTAADNQHVEVIQVNNTDMCCLRHEDSIQSLLKLVVREYHHRSNGGEHTDSVALHPSFPSAHLYLHGNISDDSSLLWEAGTGYGTAHVAGGVAYSAGSLHIPQDGVYFLYSHVTISSHHHGDDNNNVDLVHCVYRYNRNLSVVRKQLLMISKTSLSDGTRRTSYVAASLRLRHDDEVFVEVSNTSLIYNFAPANFFGIYMLK